MFKLFKTVYFISFNSKATSRLPNLPLLTLETSRSGVLESSTSGDLVLLEMLLLWGDLLFLTASWESSIIRVSFSPCTKVHFCTFEDYKLLGACWTQTNALASIASKASKGKNLPPHPTLPE